MKVAFHSADDPNGPIGIYLTAADGFEVRMLQVLMKAVSGQPGINACPTDDASKGFDHRVINGVLDIFPSGAQS